MRVPAFGRLADSPLSEDNDAGSRLREDVPNGGRHVVAAKAGPGGFGRTPRVSRMREDDVTRVGQSATDIAPRVAACLASLSQVSTTVSGLSDMLSILRSTSHSARSGWSDGPCPQMPT